MQGCKELKGCIGSMQMQASRPSIMLHKVEVLDMLGMLSNGVALTCLPELTICNLHRCSNQLKRMQITHQCNMGVQDQLKIYRMPKLGNAAPVSTATCCIRHHQQRSLQCQPIPSANDTVSLLGSCACSSRRRLSYDTIAKSISLVLSFQWP